MRDDNEALYGCGCFVLLLVIGLIFGIVKNNERNTYTFTVSGKERQCDSSGDTVDCYFVVFGADGEVFENRDSMFNSKWDSASMHARFIPGKRYTVRTIGWRVPFLSMKPNIITAEEVR